jgi:single-stranded-DNA-specific exonuclease
MQWQLLSSEVPQNIDDVRSILLKNRSIVDEDEFFAPTHPKDFTVAAVGINVEQMKKAVERIKTAHAQEQHVVIFGDYDADGICATAILWRALRAYGLVAEPFIPRRDTHGYGISKKALDEIVAKKKPDLIISVDNGIVAHEALAYAQEIGIDVIVTDHHQPEKVGNDFVFPPAVAVVHTTKLCGSTVSWMLAREFSVDSALEDLDLAAIATIADQVVLKDFNRSFAMHGLKVLCSSRKTGIKALAELASVDLSQVNCRTVGYTLAPRINAMGRLAHGMDALRLLCTKSWETARKLARLLDTTNTDRQEMTMDQYDIAVQQVKLQMEESVLVVHSDQFHEGVIGLIAGRLVEQFGKPAIVLSVNEATAKGSARSIPSINIVELLRLVREDLLEVGGHPMAAGLGVVKDKIEVIKTKLFTLAKETVTAEMLVPKIQIDMELPNSMLNIQTAESLAAFDPFGSGNPEPLFAVNDMLITGVQTIGKEGKHLKLQLEADGQKLEALAWGKGDTAQSYSNGQVVSAAIMLSVNEWKNKKRLQVVARDINNQEA